MSPAGIPDVGAPAHVGHIVPDIEEAMAAYTEQLGVTWASIVEHGKGRNASRFTCTQQGPVLIELIQEIPGSIWSTAQGQPFHHLAYWTDDLRTSSDALVARGLTIETAGPTFAYLRGAGGSRIELMDRSVEPAWNTWLAGGRFVLG